MELSQTDGNDKKQSESLLDHGNEIEIVGNGTRTVKRFPPLCQQLLGCSSPLLCSVAIGNVVGFTSILILQLKNDDGPIKTNASNESWIASISTASMAIACVFGGISMEKYGRKPLISTTCACFFFCWMILSFSSSLLGLLFGRFLTGFCAGLLATTLTVYIGEITQPSYRGLFLSAQGFAFSTGILVPHALGMYLKWKTIAVICALIPLLCCSLIARVPESPFWLLAQGRIKDAAEAFTWLFGHGHDAVDEFERMVDGHESAKLQNNSHGLGNTMMLVRSKLFYKPYLILLVYIATLQSCGPNVIAFYTITILKKSLGDNMNEYIATIIIDVTRVITSAFSCIVVQNFGRRPLTTFSGMATATTLFALSIYLHAASKDESLKSLYGIPLTLFMLYIIFITIGLNPLAWALKGELFPLRYRGAGSAMITFTNSTFVFVSVKTTPSLFEVLGEQGVFCLFGACCLLGTILLTIFLPETRNKTLQDIEDSY